MPASAGATRQSLRRPTAHVDENPAAHEAVRATADLRALDRLTTVAAGAPQLWARITDALRPGGCIAARIPAADVFLLRGWTRLSERAVATGVLEVVARRP
ncbi:hypothetical protein [Mumia sp. Pv 4-285]|uniref:hypothetical protein n=1 Tax=Mumia qirimensis TaxID=3234852 RepID=UPI00351D759B